MHSGSILPSWNVTSEYAKIAEFSREPGKRIIRENLISNR